MSRSAATGGGCLTDVAGIAVGHHSRSTGGWCTGTTMVLLPEGSTVGVDVRGGGPGTRETDVLNPVATVQTAHAICLTGGSAYGLAAADGAMLELESRGIGFAVGVPGGPGCGVVPIVPAAVIFDLGRGGSFGRRPDADFGRRATRAARRRPSANGTVGAGTGARAGGLRGGLGTASTTVELPGTAEIVDVAALAVVNAAGSPFDPRTGLPWEPGDDRLRRPTAAERDRLLEIAAAAVPPLNTTIGVVATSARLTKPEVTRLATVAHDGLARAVRPVHSLFDGDTIFGAATGDRDLEALCGTGAARTRGLNAILAAAAHCFAAACTNAVVRADGPTSYSAVCPSAFRRER